MIEESVQQEEITIMIVNMRNKRTYSYVKQVVKVLKKEAHPNTIKVGEANTPLMSLSYQERKSIRKQQCSHRQYDKCIL